VGSVVNLNRVRKARKRAEAQQRAAENRAIFGRSKKERRDSDDSRRRSERDIDGKRLD
jgi:hypothetical protein